jgi:asparagine synthase (glutamine-hydrolysing)
MSRVSMSRIRGFVALAKQREAKQSDFLRMPAPLGVRFHVGGFSCGQLASTDRSCLARQKIGSTQIFLCWDGHFFGKEGSHPARLLGETYRQGGFPSCVSRWHGDFALALYDESARTLFLVRDRIGIRPLYYVATREWVAFSSQPVALTALAGVGREPNPVFLGLYAGCHYRTFDNDPHASPYLHIRQLPAGHWLRWCAGAWEVQRYWNLADHGDFSQSEKELAQRYRKKLFHAVQRPLEIAKNPGFLLSGGMDSSSVLSASVRLTGQKQKAYSSTYADSAYDESGEIQTILQSKVSRWSNVRVEDKNILETIRQMVRIHEEPVATATWLSHYQVCRQAAQDGISDLITGLGGDELNAGEYEHFLFFFADLHRFGKKSALQKEIRGWQRYHNHPIYRKNRTIAMGLIRNRTDSAIPGSVRPDAKLFSRYRGCINSEIFDLSLFHPVLDRIFQDSLKNRCYQDIFRETAPCCLRAQDRHGWAFGLPHHNPFYESELVEFMFRVPGVMKIRGGVTKHLLRQAMRGILPESTRTRIKKTGWNAPAHLWFSGKNASVLKEMIRSRKVRSIGIYNVPEVDKVIDEHQAILNSGRLQENHMMFLWQTANLCIWLGA